MEIDEAILTLICLNQTNLASTESFFIESNIKIIWSTIIGMEPDADAIVTTVDTEVTVMAGGASPSKNSGSTLPLEASEEVRCFCLAKSRHFSPSLCDI